MRFLFSPFDRLSHREKVHRGPVCCDHRIKRELGRFGESNQIIMIIVVMEVVVGGGCSNHSIGLSDNRGNKVNQ